MKRATQKITREYLLEHPNHVFVFGDNTLRKGKAGAAKLRGLKNTYGFITKRFPGTKPTDYYTVDEYRLMFEEQYGLLELRIKLNPTKTYLISKIGSGLADKYGIFDAIIYPGILKLKAYSNAEFLFE